jgi:hypothetical protein
MTFQGHFCYGNCRIRNYLSTPAYYWIAFNAFLGAAAGPAKRRVACPNIIGLSLNLL